MVWIKFDWRMIKLKMKAARLPLKSEVMIQLSERQVQREMSWLILGVDLMWLKRYIKCVDSVCHYYYSSH